MEAPSAGNLQAAARLGPGEQTVDPRSGGPDLVAGETRCGVDEVDVGPRARLLRDRVAYGLIQQRAHLVEPRHVGFAQNHAQPYPAPGLWRGGREQLRVAEYDDLRVRRQLMDRRVDSLQMPLKERDNFTLKLAQRLRVNGSVTVPGQIVTRVDTVAYAREQTAGQNVAEPGVIASNGECHEIRVRAKPALVSLCQLIESILRRGPVCISGSIVCRRWSIVGILCYASSYRAGT